MKVCMSRWIAILSQGDQTNKNSKKSKNSTRRSHDSNNLVKGNDRICISIDVCITCISVMQRVFKILSEQYLPFQLFLTRWRLKFNVSFNQLIVIKMLKGDKASINIGSLWTIFDLR